MHQTISHYRVLERLGSGGTAHVCKALDLTLKRIVVIKSVHPAQDDKAIGRLPGEAQMAAALSHPNIATVYEVVKFSGQFYLAMEFVDGETLQSRIERSALDISASLDVAIQVADALAAAHARNLIHCDIKPSNIMITPAGLVKVLDFGLARQTEDATNRGSSSAMLRTENATLGFEASMRRGNLETETIISGTPGYMSPEQMRGEVLDQRTDIFSLGVVLYEMLTTRLPFNGDGARELFHSVLNDEPASLGVSRTDAPLKLERIVRRALAKSRDERYGSAKDVLVDLLALKRQFESSNDLASTFVADEAIGTAGRDSVIIEPHRLTSLRAVAWRHRRSLALVGALAAGIAVWEMVSFQPRGAEWLRPAGLLLLAAACVW